MQTAPRGKTRTMNIAYAKIEILKEAGTAFPEVEESQLLFP